MLHDFVTGLPLSPSTDTMSELELVQKLAKESGAFDAVICNHWALGGHGAADLADSVIEASSQPSKFEFLYTLEVRTKSLLSRAFLSRGERF